MRKKIGILLIFIMLVTSLLSVFSVETVKASGNILFVGGGGSGNFTTIQSAIDAANDGDTVFVYNGTYYNPVLISKEITLLGKSKEGVILDGVEISIQHSNTTVSGFTIKNAPDAAIWLYGQYEKMNITISNNEIYNALRGIHFDMWKQPENYSCLIYNNTIHDITNYPGIWVLRTNNVTIYKNTIYNVTNSNLGAGILVEGRPNEDPSYTCKDILIQNNDIYNCRADGIRIDGAENLLVYNNTIHKSKTGLAEDGIQITDYNNNITITKNDISGEGWATWVYYPSNTNININNNYYHDNYGYAFLGAGSSGVKFENNTLYNNKRGIGLDNWGEDPTYYEIRYNNIINTGEPGFIGTSYDLAHENLLTSTNILKYNYWSDYNGIDENNDGIGDVNYSIGPNLYVDTYDEMPLYGIYPFGASFEYSLSDLNITLNATSYDYNGGNIINYTWSLGDGTNAYTANVAHSYSSAGVKTVSLTVQNSTTTDTITYNIYVGTPPTMMYVDDDYNSSISGWKYNRWDNIQDAGCYINSGTISVSAGTYNESIYIYNKSVNLIGENADKTVIDSLGERFMDYYGLDMGGSTLQLNGVHDSEVSGFTIQNAGAGYNRACFSYVDFIDEPPNEGKKQLTGISMNMNIHDNIIRDAGTHNVLIASFRDSEFYNNTIYNTVYGVGATYGVGLWNDDTSFNALIHNNTVYNISNYGIFSYVGGRTIYNNHVYNCYKGIALSGSNQGTKIYKNYVTGCYYGIYAGVSTSSAFYIFKSNMTGKSNNRFIVNGTTWIGEIQSFSSSALFYHNNLINNWKNAFDSGTNTWYNITLQEGNYWSDFTGLDNNGNGIGDTPYKIPGGDNQDLYPFIYSNGWLNKQPIANFTYTPINPTINDIIQFTDISIDTDGSIVSWYWNFGDHYFSDLQNPVHVYYQDGSYNATLIVIDNQGATNTSRQTINCMTICVLGDMNGDGSLNSGDVRWLAIYVASNGMDPNFRPLYANGDVNCDSNLNTGDVRYLAIYYASNGKDPDFSPLYPSCNPYQTKK